MLNASHSSALPRLPKALQAINEAVAVADAAHQDADFFHNLCEYVIPLLQSMPLLGTIRKQWSDAYKKHMQKMERATSSSKRQVRRDYQKISTIVKEANILSLDGLMPLLTKIDDLLNNRDPYYTPTEFEVAYDTLCEVCSLLVRNGHTPLIQDYVTTVIQTDSYSTPPYAPQELITEFRIAPAITDLRKLRSVWFWQAKDPWVIWQHLCNAVWAWNCPPNIFAKNTMKNSTEILRRRTMHTLNQQNFLTEMNRFKGNKNNDSRVWNNKYFTGLRFREWLRIILVDVVAKLAKMNLTDNSGATAYQISLFLCDVQTIDTLWVTIQWNEGGHREAYCLQRFQENSATHEFAQQLVKNIGENIITVSSRSPADLISRCNLKGSLRNIFFGESQGINTLFRGCHRTHVHFDPTELQSLLHHLRESHKKAGDPDPPAEVYR